MKVVLFCKNPYAFAIMQPLYNELIKLSYSPIWYFPIQLMNQFPKSLKESQYCHTIKELYHFNAEINFIPGNDFPYYLPGVKIQIFHGLAGEKKGHFRVRKYFDLYLTQGPYFTSIFNKLSRRYKDFKVIQTGWSKLDTLFNYQREPKQESENLILYAPTFSPKLSSAKKYQEEIIGLSNNKQNKIVIKFHDKMSREIIEHYTTIISKIDNIEISNEPDIIPLLQQSDILISDTSSVVYEFLLLNKPVITLESTSKNIRWANIIESNKLYECIENNLKRDPFKKDRKWIIDNYHPYSDGNSSKRMIQAALDYIKEYGVPKERKLPFLRKRKINKIYGKCPKI